MKDILNRRVKHRESFRPFAPSIKDNYSKKYFHLDCPSPYMLLIAKVKKKRLIPSVTHIDGTARVQTVSKKSNSKFYDLLDKFQKLTGVPCVLNTSFNDAGDPIVESPMDALQTFFKCDMDFLYLGDYLIHKKNQKNIKNINKKITRDIKLNILQKRKKILKKFFKNYSKNECKKFIFRKNKESIYNLVFKNYNQFNIKINNWKNHNKKILIVGDQHHTNLLFRIFPKLNVINIIGFINYLGNSSKKLNILN